MIEKHTQFWFEKATHIEKANFVKQNFCKQACIKLIKSKRIIF
jgi:hypothetical protein